MAAEESDFLVIKMNVVHNGEIVITLPRHLINIKNADGAACHVSRILCTILRCLFLSAVQTALEKYRFDVCKKFRDFMIYYFC